MLNDHHSGIPINQINQLTNQPIDQFDRFDRFIEYKIDQTNQTNQTNQVQLLPSILAKKEKYTCRPLPIVRKSH